MIKNSILEEDLGFIANDIFNSNNLQNSSILVTGATGLIGSLIVKTILYANRNLNSNVTIFASIRNLDKAKLLFKDFIQDVRLHFITEDISKPLTIDKKIDFIIHTASITSSKEMVENPTGVLLTAFESTKNLLEFIKERNSHCRMIYISSMEYYGQLIEGYDDVTEDKLGYIDITNIRSCYPESKRVCEILCNAYADQFKLNVCNARLAQTFGAGVSKEDNRVFAQFAKSAVSQTDIVLHTMGLSEGNYCYTADAIYAIFLLLLKGERGHSYNISNNHSTILNMANMVAEKITDNKINVVINTPDNPNSLGYAPDVKLRLNSDKLKGLGWKPRFDLEQMFRRMIMSWEQEK